MKLEELVPPLELCKKIPAGEFEDSAFLWEAVVDMNTGETVNTHTVPRPSRIGCNPFVYHEIAKEFHLYPAPTFDEILDELHKCQEDVFVKWSETAYHGWLVNAYSHGRNEDYQAHDQIKTTAAMKLWLEVKGIKDEQ